MQSQMFVYLTAIARVVVEEKKFNLILNKYYFPIQTFSDCLLRKTRKNKERNIVCNFDDLDRVVVFSFQSHGMTIFIPNAIQLRIYV